MKDGLNVLSLFNGMGCIWYALEANGIKVNKAYSSEIEKYPNQANDLIYPKTIQLGDVRNVKGSDLGFIDLLAGGSPCQSFSFAGKRKGMAAIEKEEFVPPTKEEYENYLLTIESDSITENDYDDYVEYCRMEFENKSKEVIEILTLEHYLELKEQDFEFEGQSYLFWEYIRIYQELKAINPDIKFLLENVVMGSKWQKILTRAIGINPIRINANLVSAQNRDRLFWTNIYTVQDGFFGDLKCMIPQPKDRGIYLKYVLEKFENSDFETEEEFFNYIEKYFLSVKAIEGIFKHKEKENGFGVKFHEMDGKMSAIKTGGKGIDDIVVVNKQGNVKPNQNKSSCFPAGGNSGGNHSDMDLICHNMMPRSSKTGKGGTGHLSRTDGKTYCLDTGNTNAIEIKKRGVIQLNDSKESGGGQPYQQNRVYDTNGLSPCLGTTAQTPIVEVFGADFRKDEGLRIRKNGKSGTLAARARNDESCGQLAIVDRIIRRLTPREAGRLQSIPEDKLDRLIKSGISDTHLYKMFGNGWNIEVISHIFSFYNY